MRVLIDTHTFLWFINGDNQLSRTARQIMEDPGNERVISIASLWEIAIKVAVDKMRLTEPYNVLIPAELDRNVISILDLTRAHLSLVATLPFHNKDPFDRVLATQAVFEGLQIVSTDSIFDAYGVERLW